MDERHEAIWSDLALHQVKKVILFYFQKTGNKMYSQRLKNELSQVVILISENPELGKLFKNSNFRYINILSFILVYKVIDDTISLVLFWDNRRSPKSLRILLDELS
jgi:plasmid stabilization system protein ParE